MRLFHIVPKLTMFFLFVSIVVYGGHAATVGQHTVTIDVEEVGQPADVTIELFYKDITSEQVSYLIPYTIENLQVSDEQGRLSCTQRQLAIGTEILCEPRKRNNYSITIDYASDSFLTPLPDTRQAINYSYSVANPTEQFVVRFILPEGYGVVESNGSASVTPQLAQIGSTGRRIFVEWDRQEVPLGDTLAYSAQFENLTFLQRFPYIYIVPFVLIILVLTISLFVARSRQRGSRVDEAYHALKSEEQQIIDYLRSREGECKQRDIVKALDLSKAKASRLIADLEERALVEKIQRGRSNRIRLRD